MIRFVLTAAAILCAAIAGISQDSTWSQNVSPLPQPTGFVNDYAGVLSEATKRDLEATLKNLKETTSPQIEIAVAIVRTTGERPIFDYSLAVARGWGIGSKADDNPSGLLLIAIDDRKYITQVSKDLEDELPDGILGQLQRQYLVPEFKKGNYDKGVSDIVAAYIATIRSQGNKSANANTATSNNESVSGTMFGAFCCLIVVVVILIIIFSRSGRGPTKRDRDRWGGGGFGSGGDVGGALPWVIGGILGSGGSSSSSSSDWGGSSSDWGGFGGGGDFGGGGAGGDW